MIIDVGTATHALLSSVHSDVTADTFARGDTLYVPSSGKLTRLPKPSALSGLSHDGTDVSWVTATGTGAPVRATSPTFATSVALTPASNIASLLKVNAVDGTPRVVTGINPSNSAYGGLWMGNVAADDTNFALTSNGSLTIFNSGATLKFQLAISTYLQIDSSAVLISPQSSNLTEIRNSTAAQRVRIANTVTTPGTAGEWLKLDWQTTANQIRIGAAKGSSSGTARVMSLDYGGTEASPVEAMRIPATSGNIVFGGGITLADPGDIVIGASTGSKVGQGTSKVGFWGATPVLQQVLATGASKTVDDVITLLQIIGLCKQS